jgi:hypothetical protein
MRLTPAGRDLITDADKAPLVEQWQAIEHARNEAFASLKALLSDDEIGTL